MDPVVVGYLREQADTLRGQEEAVRTDVPDSIHQARVAVRKIRSALRVFAADEPGAGPLDDRLREWGRTLGRARDAEVVRELLRTRARMLRADDGRTRAARELADRLDRQLAREYEGARTAVLDVLGTPEHTALLAELDRFAVPTEEEASHLVAAARGARKTFRKRERKAGRLSGPDADRAWHRARRAAKRARYAAELVRDAVPGKPARTYRDHARRLRKAQSRLGARQDEVALRGWLARQRSRARDDGEDLTPYDVLLHPDTA
ncbi:CHAD domain-containing protein [Myceligenerans indicum]|uniref:CHAD domain-containing protein n=1 Tax=Myceligenerans indicum TaxID=2593663 RepID=A0ABS1LL82_9MICO|nr:CHAD domain-containing protein [Myceligenerans indicum]MBL0886986.1 CHAD domain-containing protein [Myceligenerans indicum]